MCLIPIVAQVGDLAFKAKGLQACCAIASLTFTSQLGFTNFISPFQNPNFVTDASINWT